MGTTPSSLLKNVSIVEQLSMEEIVVNHLAYAYINMPQLNCLSSKLLMLIITNYSTLIPPKK